MAAPSVVFVAGLLGAAAGAFVATRWAPGPGSRDVPAEGSAASVAELRDEVAGLRLLLERPGALGAPAALGARAAGDGAAPGEGAARPGDAPLRLADVEAVVTKAVEGALAQRDADAKAAAAAAKAPKPRKPLAEVARELNLTGTQEDAVRAAYREATDRMLKVMAEPESDPETLRRELEAAKGDRAKSMGLVTKYMPKFLTKLGDVMTIQAERDDKIRKAVGDDGAAKLDRYRIEEEDPFGLDGDVSVGVRAGG